MNYGQLKKKVLELLNQSTIAGELVPGSYNNQQDYLNRIPGLANDAIMEIATVFRQIPSTVELKNLPNKVIGEVVRYEMPENFFRLMSGDTVKVSEDKIIHTNSYSIQGHKYLLVPKKDAGDYTITYFRYPNLLDDKPDDMDSLDNEPETYSAVAYYVAAFLVDHDDPHLAALFNNKYEDLCARMMPKITAEVHPVGDVYGFGRCDY